MIAAGIAMAQICAVLAVSLAVASGDWNEGSPGTGIPGWIRLVLVIPAVLAGIVAFRAALGRRIALVTLLSAEAIATVAGAFGLASVLAVRLVVVASGLAAGALAIAALALSSASLPTPVAREVSRDLSWDILVTTSERLGQRYDPGSVRASQRWRGLWMVAGIEAPRFGVFEPVMRRRPFTRRWEELVPIQEAASRAAAALKVGRY